MTASGTASSGGRLAPFAGRAPSAFTLAGTLIVASAVVPVALEPVTDWHWAAGLLLVGAAVLAVAAGLAGLYPAVRDRAPRLAAVGVAFAGLAAAAASALIVLVGSAVVAESALGVDLQPPSRAFAAVALAMGGGFAVGLATFGVAGLRTGTPERGTALLLIAGGALLSGPVAVELLGLAVDGTTPPWVLFPVIGLVAIDVLAVGLRLRSAEAR